MIMTGESGELKDKPVPVTLCVPQIPYGQAWGSNLCVHVEGW
jgi:hypothetical protein